MIDIKEAVTLAAQYLEHAPYVNATDIRLEEVELSDDDAYRFVTLSHADSMLTLQRQYKLFKIDAKTGNIKFMKIHPF
jgi:hypothetical protein